MAVIKKIILLLGLLLVFIAVTDAKGKKELSSFEYELAKFKYDLYKDLNLLSSSKIMQFDIQKDDSIYHKISEFCETHIEDIHKYQLQVLESKKEEVVYAEKDYEDEGVGIFDFSTYKEEMNTGLYRLIFINPFSYANTIVTAIDGQEMSASELGAQSIKDKIAQPKVSTKSIDKNSWEITVDKYDKVYVISFNIIRNEIKVLKVLKRIN